MSRVLSLCVPTPSCKQKRKSRVQEQTTTAGKQKSNSFGRYGPYHPCITYLPTFTMKISQMYPNVGNYTIHGWYGCSISNT